MHGLSGGEGQLLALAGVLATGPTILVADEPTTLLDLGNSRRIGDLLLGLEQQLVAGHPRPRPGRSAATGCSWSATARVERDGPPTDVVGHYRATA